MDPFALDEMAAWHGLRTVRAAAGHQRQDRQQEGKGQGAAYTHRICAIGKRAHSMVVGAQCRPAIQTRVVVAFSSTYRHQNAMR
ncbi:hypothetical protein H1235_06140 [Pseudoxanthomonas sp. NC8]|nr:hypothetical protein H1235_06140 [Pseudoxanthomonas sp. NC8]